MFELGGNRFLFSLLFFTFIFSNSSHGQPAISFSKCFGGSSIEGSYSIIEKTSDHTFILVGASESNDGDVQTNYGGVDTWIINVDTSGQILWSTVCGGSQNDIPEQVINTHDGGFAVVGYTLSSQVYAAGNNLNTIGQEDIWLMKFSANFSLQWQKCLGGLGTDVVSLGKGLIETSSHEFVVLGSSLSNDSLVTGNHGSWDYFIAKVDSSGNTEWQKSLGGTLSDIGYSLIESIDHDYLLIGDSESNDGDVSGNHGGVDFWILKVDTSGSIIWQKSIGGSNNDYGRCVCQGVDSLIVFAGTTNSNDSNVSGNHGSADIFLYRTNLNGNSIQSKCYGGSGGEEIYSIKQRRDSTFLFCGDSNSMNGDVTGVHGFAVDAWVVNIDDSLNIVWQKSIGGSRDDIAIDLIESDSTAIWIAGTAESNDGDVTTSNGTAGDFWVVELNSSLNNNIESSTTKKTFSVFPNPFNTSATILGEDIFSGIENNYLLFDQFGSDCTSRIKIDLALDRIKISNINLLPGLYYLRVSLRQSHKEFSIKLIVY